MRQLQYQRGPLRDGAPGARTAQLQVKKLDGKVSEGVNAEAQVSRFRRQARPVQLGMLRQDYRAWGRFAPATRTEPDHQHHPARDYTER